MENNSRFSAMPTDDWSKILTKSSAFALPPVRCSRLNLNSVNILLRKNSDEPITRFSRSGEQRQNPQATIGPQYPRDGFTLQRSFPSCRFPLFGLQRKKDEPFNTEFVLPPPPVEADTINHHAARPDNQPDKECGSTLRQEIEKTNQNENVGKQQNQICTENVWSPVPKPLRAQKLVLVD